MADSMTSCDVITNKNSFISTCRENWGYLLYTNLCSILLVERKLEGVPANPVFYQRFGYEFACTSEGYSPYSSFRI